MGNVFEKLNLFFDNIRTITFWQRIFAREFFQILTKCETDVPRDMLGKVIEFEKADKLNPSNEKRAKQISTSDLRVDSEKIEREAAAKGIAFPIAMQDGINILPLYNGEPG